MKKRRRNKRKLSKKNRKHAVRGKVSRSVREQVYRRDNFMCQHCGAEDSQNNPLTLHHVRYRRDGGLSTVENLLVLCTRCHRHLHRVRG